MIGGDDGRKIMCLVFERRGVDIDDLLTCLRPGVGRTPRHVLDKREQLETCVGWVYELVGPTCIAEEFSERCGFRVSEKRIQRMRANAAGLRTTGSSEVTHDSPASNALTSSLGA